jgi:hypothetical protein
MSMPPGQPPRPGPPGFGPPPGQQQPPGQMAPRPAYGGPAAGPPPPGYGPPPGQPGGPPPPRNMQPPGMPGVGPGGPPNAVAVGRPGGPPPPGQMVNLPHRQVNYLNIGNIYAAILLFKNTSITSKKIVTYYLNSAFDVSQVRTSLSAVYNDCTVSNKYNILVIILYNKQVRDMLYQ